MTNLTKPPFLVDFVFPGRDPETWTHDQWAVAMFNGRELVRDQGAVDVWIYTVDKDGTRNDIAHYNADAPPPKDDSDLA